MESVGLNRRFWSGKRVLVTGHTGFKGLWLSEWLLNLGANVTGYSLEASTKPALFEQLRLAERLNHIVGDIRDFRALRAAMIDSRPEIIFHMAAQSLVRPSYLDPLETYTTNVIGTANILQLCRDLDGLKAVVVVTSDKCYENREWHWGYREYEPLGGYDPYSSSKACAEIVTAAFRRSFFNPDAVSRRTSIAQSLAAVATVRAGNVIGGGDWARDRLIPDAIRAFLAGEILTVRDPEAVRPWQHVLEPLRGYLMLAYRLWTEGNAFAEAWNFGPAENDAKPVRWILDRLCELWPGNARWKQSDQLEPYEAKNLRLDCAKAHTRLGWWPWLGLEQALRLTVDWYIAYSKGEDLLRVTREQLDRYVESDQHPEKG